MYGALRKSWSMATRSRKLRAQPVEFPDNERVTVLQCLEATEQRRALFLPCFKSYHVWNVSESCAVPIRGEKYRVEQNRSRSSSVRGFTLLDLQ